MKITILILTLISICLLPLIPPVQTPELTASIARGREIYADFCLQCHLANGEGTKGTVPPLAGSDYLKKYRIESIRSVKYGQSGKIKVNGIEYNGTMPNPNLSDEEVADVMNYILQNWGNTGHRVVTVSEVKAIQKEK